MLSAVFGALLLLLAACAAGTTAPDRSASRIRETGVLRVAVDPSYPPFAMLDGNGQIVGYDADLAHEIARRLGVRTEFVPHDVGAIFDVITADQVDVIISAIPPYREHSRRLRYTRPYYNAGQVLLVRTGTAGTGELLAGKVVGYEFGTAGELAVRNPPKELGTPAEVRSFTSPETAVEALASEQIDCFVTDRVIARLAGKANPALTIVGSPLDVDPYVVAIRRQDVWLGQMVDDIVRDLEREGFLRELEDRWL